MAAQARRPAAKKKARPATVKATAKTRAKAKPAKPAKKSSRKIELERFIRAEPAAVWRLWTTSDGLCRWIATAAELDLRPGGRAGIAMRGGAGVSENTILALEPGRRLELEWERTAKWGPTRVAVSFTPERGGTRVRLVQSGFGDGPEWDEWYESFDGGWAAFLGQLVSVAEGGGSRTAELFEKVDAPAGEVFRALGSAEGLARWFTRGEGKLEPRAGGRYDLECGPVRIEGEVREYSPGRTLALSWSTEPCTRQPLALPTIVTLHLTPLAAGGTCVSLVHSGFGDGPEWDEIYERHAETWKFLLGNLISVVSKNKDLRQESSPRA